MRKRPSDLHVSHIGRRRKREKGDEKKGTLVQIQLCIAKEKISTAARQRGYRFKQKLTLPNGRSRIHLDAKIAERFRHNDRWADPITGS
jgi:hypothetical protein